MSGILSHVNVEDQVIEAREVKAIGTIGECTEQLLDSGKMHITVPLSYRMSANDPENRMWSAHLFIRPEWFTREWYKNQERLINEATTEEMETKLTKELRSAQMNKRKLKDLFCNAGVTDGPMDIGRLTGRTVGFKTKRQFNNPERTEIDFFFAVPANVAATR